MDYIFEFILGARLDIKLLLFIHLRYLVQNEFQTVGISLLHFTTFHVLFLPISSSPLEITQEIFRNVPATSSPSAACIPSCVHNNGKL